MKVVSLRMQYPYLGIGEWCFYRKPVFYFSLPINWVIFGLMYS